MAADEPIPNIRPAARALARAIGNSVRGRTEGAARWARHRLAQLGTRAAPRDNTVCIVSGTERPTPPLGYGGVEATLHRLACDLRDRGWEVHLWGTFLRDQPALYQGMVLHEGADPDGDALLRLNPQVAYFAWPTPLQLQRLAADRRRLVMAEFNAPSCLPPRVDGVVLRCFNTLFLDEARAAGYPAHQLLLHPLWQKQETRYQPGVPREDWLLWVGRPHPAKALEEAFRFAMRTGETLRVYAPWYHGDDAYTSLLRRLQPANVQYCGELLRQDKADVFSRCKALLYTAHPGVKEAFGLIFLEALVSGTPVVALDHHAGSTQSAMFPGPPVGLRAADTDALAALWLEQRHLLSPAAVAARCAQIYDADATATAFSDTLRRLAAERKGMA
jgi:glycosyltransferase involved in cell wall biosynthesis